MFRWDDGRLRGLAVAPLLAGVFLLLQAALGCGGGSHFAAVPAPISVSLPVQTLTIAPGGTASFNVNIVSTSETGQVAVSGLPSGVGFTYAASDTNPSGLLRFTAVSSVAPGSYLATVTATSANQTASTGFTLIVSAPSGQLSFPRPRTAYLKPRQGLGNATAYSLCS